MGSYAELRVDGFYLGSTKNDLDPLVMTIFREADRRLRTGRAEEIASERGMTFDELEEAEVEIIQYACPVSHAIDRLELMGFTRDVAAVGFARGLANEVDLYEEWHRKDPTIFGDRLRLLRGIDLDKWLTGIRDIHARGLRPTSPHDSDCASLSPLLQYMVCEKGHEWYGFPGDEHRHFLRLVLDAFEPSSEVVYDLTDLVLGGWVDTTQELVDVADVELARDFVATRRVIVLTEGSTDSRILRAALRLLYPHLFDYFHFLDFESSNLGGGAGTLANIVKAFAGAGIVNRTIAVFDNDSAAHDAMRPISSAILPGSLQVTTYPRLDRLSNYPTLGPSGKIDMDVNGLAGSLELYLGASALQGTDGDPIPVQWRGYLPGVGRYQGELIDKRTPVDRFDAFVRACDEERSKPNEWDWEGLRAIIDHLRGAFHAVDSLEIEEYERADL